jgi:hypothetical protein
MPDQFLNSILNECIRMEGLAIQFYTRIAGQCDGELHDFWMDMAEQEKEHAKYWRMLLDLTKENRIRNVFDYPQQVMSELKEARSEAEQIISQITGENIEEMFLVAYRLEFTFLNPAFQALFISMKQATGDQSPGDRYQAHIHGLIQAFRKFGPRQASFELIASLSDKLLLRNEQLAQQLMEIHQLRGLLPICMYCKNIRKDDGLWINVDKYIEAHSDAKFSHGICPDCMKKLYGEYFEEGELDKL